MEGFPIVTTREEMRIAGYISKRDIKTRLGMLWKSLTQGLGY